MLLLDSGGAFACEPSNLISSCLTVQELARFLEKEKDCGSTDSQAEQNEKPSRNAVTSEHGETFTSVTSGTTDTSTRVSGSQSDKSSGFSKRSSQEKPPPLSRSLPLTEDIKSLHRKQKRHMRHIFFQHSPSHSLLALDLYSLMTSPSSFGNSPLSCSTFSLTRLPNPFLGNATFHFELV